MISDCALSFTLEVGVQECSAKAYFTSSQASSEMQSYFFCPVVVVTFAYTTAAAVVNSGVPGADEREVTKVMSAIADRVVHEFVEPFKFPNHHHRILAPYNYYEFGQVCLLHWIRGCDGICMQCCARCR